MHMAKSARKTKKPAFCRSDQLDKLCLSLEECKKSLHNTCHLSLNIVFRFVSITQDFGKE